MADVFLQLIKIITGPVIFCTVVIGIVSLGNLARAVAWRCGPGLLPAGDRGVTAPGAAGGQPRAARRGLQRRAERRRPRRGTEADRHRLEGVGLVPFLKRGAATQEIVGPFVDNKILQCLVLPFSWQPRRRLLAAPLRERILSGFD